MVQEASPGLRAFHIAAVISIFFLFGNSNVWAQNQPCGVGNKVAFEWSPDTIGTIVEIGTEHPHVGWFGIKFAWSERIQWAQSESNGLLIAGTKNKC